MKKIQLSGCAIIKNGKLLVLWKKRHGHYEFPGGRVENGENLQEAATREVREELGCDVQLGKYIGYKEFIIEGKNFQSHKFLASIQPGCIPCAKEKSEFSHIFWLPIKNYKSYSVAPNVKDFCDDYIKGEE